MKKMIIPVVCGLLGGVVSIAALTTPMDEVAVTGIVSNLESKLETRGITIVSYSHTTEDKPDYSVADITMLIELRNGHVYEDSMEVFYKGNRITGGRWAGSLTNLFKE